MLLLLLWHAVAQSLYEAVHLLEKEFYIKVNTNELFPQTCQSQFSISCQLPRVSLSAAEQHNMLVVKQASEVFLDQIETQSQLHPHYQNTINRMISEYVVYEPNEVYLKYLLQFNQIQLTNKEEPMSFIYVLDHEQRIVERIKHQPTSHVCAVSFRHFYNPQFTHHTKSSDAYYLYNPTEIGYIDISQPLIVNYLYIRNKKDKQHSVSFSRLEQQIKQVSFKGSSQWVIIKGPMEPVDRIVIPQNSQIDQLMMTANKPDMTEEFLQTKIMMHLVNTYSSLHAEAMMSKQVVEKQDAKQVKDTLIKDEIDEKSLDLLVGFLQNLRTLIKNNKQGDEISQVDIVTLVDQLAQEMDSNNDFLLKPIVMMFKEQLYTEQEIEKLYDIAVLLSGYVEENE